MNHFESVDGELACEGVPLSRIAETVGTVRVLDLEAL